MTAPRPAAFVAVGSELVRTDRLDTNSLLTARLLGRCGDALVEKRCVEDDAGAIAATGGGFARPRARPRASVRAGGGVGRPLPATRAPGAAYRLPHGGGPRRGRGAAQPPRYRPRSTPAGERAHAGAVARSPLGA